MSTALNQFVAITLARHLDEGLGRQQPAASRRQRRRQKRSAR